MGQDSVVTRERQGNVLLIGLNRVAKRNAFDMEMLRSHQALARLCHYKRHVALAT
jgi:enoyl-CoA hydratase/carnithine racemase